MNLQSILIVCSGASLGALLRWKMGVWLNTIFPYFALGTWLANILGCFLIGLALPIITSKMVKLWFVVGFLGSFTTFSSFSAEVVEHFLNEKYGWALVVLFSHGLSGLGATLMGIFIAKHLTI